MHYCFHMVTLDKCKYELHVNQLYLEENVVIIITIIRKDQNTSSNFTLSYALPNIQTEVIYLQFYFSSWLLLSENP